MRKFRKAQSRLQKKDNEDSVLISSEENLKDTLMQDLYKIQRPPSNFTNEDASRELMRRS
jgi:hypothetical protein